MQVSLKAISKKIKKKKGFTLVELIVVIIIIAIIAAVALPRIAAFQENARKSRILSEHRQLVTAIQARVSSSKKPAEEFEKIKTLESLKGYMNINDSEALTSRLAKDGPSKESAHQITDGKLVSTYTDPRGKVADSRSESWEYVLAPAGR
ncbi:prepilin-type cleavage/methylation domain-containing protein [Streptococcus oricebi]|uniref:Prepilin-type cleavage/methylation domain-containing protein n=2 Tax=Streptococcus oricebi TaxID=1547447 RepID=A0ABS5B5R8_9STRE|nr:prepilin-type cleavage/methylation domain-containing protein [Streptococcus oricebi]